MRRFPPRGVAAPPAAGPSDPGSSERRSPAPRREGLRRALVVGLVGFVGLFATGDRLGLLSAAGPPLPGRPTTATILRRADLVRNPSLGTAVDIDLSVVSRASGRALRRARFIMLTHRRGRTLLLMPTDDPSAPGALLIADDAYWLLLPQAKEPIRLPFRQVVAGDLSHAGFLRLDLWTRYTARYAGDETVDGVPCWRLELEPNRGTDPGSRSAPFGKVRYWVAQSGFLPIRIEFFDPTNKLLKTVRFTKYQQTGLGRRPARIEIEDTGRPGERATLTLGQPRGVPTSGLDFDLDDLSGLRDTARSLGAGDDVSVGGLRLVRALQVAARRRPEP